MPRYFFDVHDGTSSVDKEGTFCRDVASARREALRTAGAMLSDAQEMWTGELWTMEVRDEAGVIVVKLTFSAI